jgi:hypothetical protein
MDKTESAGVASRIGEGSTKTAEATAGRSEVWQQDIVQEAMPDTSWLQSIACLGVADDR